MPRVPTPERLVSPTAPAPLRQRIQPAEDPTSGVVAGVAGKALDLVDKFRKERRQQEVVNRSNRVLQDMTNLMTAAEVGLLRQTGEKAEGNITKFRDFVDNIEGNYGQDLDANEKAMLMRSVGGTINAHLTDLNNHTAKELHNAKNTAFDDTTGLALRDAALGHGSDALIAASRQRFLSAVKSKALLNGDDVEKAVLAAESTFFKATIERAIAEARRSGDFTRAEELLNRHSESLDTKSLDSVTSYLEKSQDRRVFVDERQRQEIEKAASEKAWETVNAPRGWDRVAGWGDPEWREGGFSQEQQATWEARVDAVIAGRESADQKFIDGVQREGLIDGIAEHGSIKAARKNSPAFDELWNSIDSELKSEFNNLRLTEGKQDAALRLQRQKVAKQDAEALENYNITFLAARTYDRRFDPTGKILGEYAAEIGKQPSTHQPFLQSILKSSFEATTPASPADPTKLTGWKVTAKAFEETIADQVLEVAEKGFFVGAGPKTPRVVQKTAELIGELADFMSQIPEKEGRQPTPADVREWVNNSDSMKALRKSNADLGMKQGAEAKTNGLKLRSMGGAGSGVIPGQGVIQSDDAVNIELEGIQ